MTYREAVEELDQTALTLDLPGRGAWWTILRLLEAAPGDVAAFSLPEAAATLGVDKHAAETILTQLEMAGAGIPRSGRLLVKGTGDLWVCPALTSARRRRDSEVERVRKLRKGTYDENSVGTHDKAQVISKQTTYIKNSVRTHPVRPKSVRTHNLGQPVDTSGTYDENSVGTHNKPQAIVESGSYPKNSVHDGGPARNGQTPLYPHKELNTPTVSKQPNIPPDKSNGAGAPRGGQSVGSEDKNGSPRRGWAVGVMKSFPVLVTKDPKKNNDTLRRIMLMADASGEAACVAYLSEAINNGARAPLAYAEHVQSADMAKKSRGVGNGKATGPRQAPGAEWQQSPYKG